MPDDLLLPAFTLTLLANAILVAMAIRGLRRGRFDGGAAPARRAEDPAVEAARVGATRASVARDAAIAAVDAERPGLAAARPLPAVDVPAAAPETLEPGTRLATPDATAAPSDDVTEVPRQRAGPAGAGRTTRGARRERPSAASTPDGAPASVTEAAPDAAPPAPADEAGELTPRADSTRLPVAGVSSGAAASASDPAPTGRRRSRRKFALPPLEHDQRIERSIETFLAGTDGDVQVAPSAVAEEGDERSSTVGASPEATTVALVALVGSADVSAGPSSSESWTDAAAVVERTIRGAARGTDLVDATNPGRYRIVLHGTGELAARAYLRRIRASVEPLLVEATPKLELVTATSTVLDEPVDVGVAVAERRLAAVIHGIADLEHERTAFADARAEAD
jgi:hypothetical protein